MDAGQLATEAAVRRMERRLRAVYREAQKDITNKLRGFNLRHLEKDKRLRELVKAGKLAQEDYDAWLRGQVFQGAVWQEKRDAISDVLTNANKKAAQIMNDERVNVFAANANYINYRVEKGSKYTISFNLYDENTVKKLLKDQPELLPRRVINGRKDKAWNRRKISNSVTQGIIQGESIPQLSSRIARDTGMSSLVATTLYARTAMTAAQNIGRIEAMHRQQDMGIKVRKRWIATKDSRTRDTHAELDGQIKPIDEPFIVDDGKKIMEIMEPGDPNADPSLVYNCFVGETNVATDSDIIRSYKHDYSGELIEVETASGVKFTCTPNHPILTPRGWVSAALLNDGDNLLIASIGNSCGFNRNGNIEHIHSRMKALHNALHGMGLMSRDSTLRVDFHGDIPTTDVEVITKKWKLRGNRDSGCADSVDKLLFKDSNEPLVSKSAFMQHFGRVRLASLRFMCGFCEALAFFGRGLAHAVIHGFGTVARSDTAILEPQADSMTGDMQFLRESLDRFPGKVFVDNIVNINITTVSHIPVYNLQTGNSRYFVNTIITQNGEKCNGNFAIAHNCRCSIVSDYPDYPDFKNDDDFREWLKSKGG